MDRLRRADELISIGRRCERTLGVDRDDGVPRQRRAALANELQSLIDNPDAFRRVEQQITELDDQIGRVVLDANIDEAAEATA
jgi:hypothetical protein